MATALLRRRIVEYFAHGKGLKLTLVSGQIGFVLADVITKLKTVCDAIHPDGGKSIASRGWV